MRICVHAYIFFSLFTPEFDEAKDQKIFQKQTAFKSKNV